MDDALKHSVIREYRRAREYYDSTLRQNNERAYKYYNEQAPTILDADVEECFQGIVSPDVANVVEHSLADIMPAFASESPVTFIPQSPEEEIQAQTETHLVNNIFIQQSNGYIELLTAIKDAFLLRIGAIEVQTYKKIVVEYMELKGVDVGTLTSIIQQSAQEGKEATIVKVNGELVENVDEELLDSILDVELRQTYESQQLYIDSFSPDELLIAPECESMNLDESPFVARERILKTSELIELGYDKEIVDSLPTYHTSQLLKPNRQRDNDLQDFREGTHESTRPIRVAFCYYRIDEDGDGIAELRRIVLAGNLPEGAVVLDNKPVFCQPYCIGVPFIYPHRFYGVSLYDKIKQVQDINTKITRQLLTAGERAVRGRLGVVGNSANPVDIKTTQFGGIIRMTTPNGIVPIPVDAFPEAVSDLLAVTNKRRQESGGSAVDKATEEIAVGGDTAHGMERIMSAMEQLSSLVAKVLAETLLRQVYIKIHYNLRQYFNQPLSAKVDGNWIQSVPSLWPERQHVAIALGLTMGDRLRQAQAYSQLIETNLQLLEKGNLIVNEQSLYRLLVNRANALMIPNAHSYYVDPTSEEGQQAAQQQQQAAQEQAQKEEQARKEQLNLLPQVEAIKGQNAAYVQQLRNEVQNLEALLKKASDDNKLAAQYDELRVKLIELNAMYDKAEVPDVLPKQ